MSTAILVQSNAFAAPIAGTMETTTPLGQFMSLKMTIGDATTRFELTGPDFSYFAFGFDTTTMQGYSFIVEGTDGVRTVVEQNLPGIGNPGSPQATQNITLISTSHNSALDLSTVILERPNQTGDPNDAVFSTSMTSLNVIWAYNSFASPQFPAPNIDYHGSNGRGVGVITFAPVPEPHSLALCGACAIAASTWRRLQTRARVAHGRKTFGRFQNVSCRSLS